MNNPIPGDMLPMEFYAERGGFSHAVSLHLRRVVFNEWQEVAVPVTFVKQEGCAMVPPFMKLTMHEAQGLMDQLWHCGLRPTEGTGSAGSLAATERHLKDMQAIAFGALQKKGVLL